MKKTLFFVCFSLLVSNMNAQILSRKKELKKHESFPVYLWFNPVIEVDSVSLEEGGENYNKLFLIEGYLNDGKPILVLVNGKTLKFLLRLPTKQKVQNQLEFEGYLFTGESLGQKSIDTDRKIKKSKIYFEKQKDLLKRNKNKEKWQLWGETPTKVRGYLSGTKFLPVAEESRMRYRPPN